MTIVFHSAPISKETHSILEPVMLLRREVGLTTVATKLIKRNSVLISLPYKKVIGVYCGM